MFETQTGHMDIGTVASARASRGAVAPQSDARRLEREARKHLRSVPAPKPLPKILSERDPAVIRRHYRRLAWVIDRYFRTEVRGGENLSDRASLIVGTHNGAMFTPDLYALMLTFWRRFGMETPFYGLTHEVLLRVPVLGELFRAGGSIPASAANADLALQHDFPVLVYPGGDVDAVKPWAKRHQICFAGRRGYVRTAIRNQVPIIPVISAGAHEVIIVLNDGQKLARRSGIAKWLRVKSVPLALSVPFGLTFAGLPSIPLPAKVQLRILPPIELCEHPHAADDAQVVERCARHVEHTMQRALDELAANRRFPFFG
jgi:1-acyl-sn-glycerol-3-phosphate acyltransferase